MTTCVQDKRVTSFLLGDLPPAEAAAFQQHLATCPACQAAARELEPVLADLKTALAADGVSSPSLDASRRANILAAQPEAGLVINRLPVQRTGGRVIQWIAKPRAWLVASAACLVLLAWMSLLLMPASMKARRVASCLSSPACCEMEQASVAPLAKPDEDDKTGQDRPFALSAGQSAGDLGRYGRGDEPADSSLAESQNGSGNRASNLSTPKSATVAGYYAGGGSLNLSPVSAPSAAPTVNQVIAGQLLGDVQTASRSGSSSDGAGLGVDDAAGADLGDKGFDVNGSRKSRLGMRQAYDGRSAGGRKADGKDADADKDDIVVAVRPSSGDAVRDEAGKEEAFGMLELAKRGAETKQDQPRGGASPAAASSVAAEARHASGKLNRELARAKHADDSRLLGNRARAIQPQEKVAEQSVAQAADKLEAVSSDLTCAAAKDGLVKARATAQGASRKSAAAEDVSKESVATGMTDGKPASAASDQEIEKKLKSIVVPEINFRSANIKDAVTFFADASREYDNPGLPAEKRGLNFVVKTPLAKPNAPAVSGAQPGPSTTDPFADVGSESGGEAGASPLTFSARFVSLWDALKITTEVGGYKTRIRNGAVIIEPATVPDSGLVTCTYDVPPALLEHLKQVAKDLEGSKDQGESFDASKTDWKAFLSCTGVNAPAGASATYDAKSRKLTVVNSEEQQAHVKQVIGDFAARTAKSPRPAKALSFNPFVAVAENRFSTFGIGVDTASYTLLRQALQGGSLPDPEQVRTEEIVNAFDYGDEAPGQATFRIVVEGAPSPFGAPGLTTLRIGIKGRRLGREEQRPAMLTFRVDTSGSMSESDRIGRARTALKLLLDRLAPRDRIQLIAFDDRARLVLPPTPARDKKAVLNAFDGLQCNGSTDLEAGMRQAYTQAARAFIPGGENRVILISDGVANLGADDAQEIVQQVSSFRRQGVTCSIFGVGSGTYNDAMLADLANKGGGVYRFLDTDEEVRRVFVDDLAATLNAIARDVKIQVEWSPEAVRRYRQLGYESRALKAEQFRDDRVEAGEVGSGQSVTALYQLERIPNAEQQPLGTVRVRYRRTDTGAIEEIARPITASDLAPSVAAARPALRLACGAAAFAELLRGSPFAGGATAEDVARLLRPVALEMPLDTRVKELVSLVEAARRFAGP